MARSEVSDKIAEPENRHQFFIEKTAEIVAAHLRNNTVALSELPALISGVYGTISGLGVAAVAEEPRPQPAVPIKKSVTRDFLICLEDGKKLRMLKRHLHSAYGLTPEAYRERWGLSNDYPMVAPGYSEKRSTLAKQAGLGRRPTQAQASAVQRPASAPKAKGSRKTVAGR